tara:strand:+ start:471 stop:725 length:255 start_codon:yes stop_codon:yes gene_type:complete
MKIINIFIFLLLTISSIPNSSKAETVYRNELYDNSLTGGEAYTGGGETYYSIPESDLRRNSLYDYQLEDRDGNIYNCDSLGRCR